MYTSDLRFWWGYLKVMVLMRPKKGDDAHYLMENDAGDDLIGVTERELRKECLLHNHPELREACNLYEYRLKKKRRKQSPEYDAFMTMIENMSSNVQKYRKMK